MVGELNYSITAQVHAYIQRKGLCYATLNEVIGVLECAKLELYRMVAAPYENSKRTENGPISILDSTEEELKPKWKCTKCGRVFKHDECHEICGSELTYYQCPNRKCNADSKYWKKYNG